jgi:hypothetical protein
MGSLNKRTLDEYKSWVKRLSDEEFNDYLEKWADFSNSLWEAGTESPNNTSTIVRGEAYRIDQVNLNDRKEVGRREAAIYFALALWKAFDAK